jgi:4-hydroxy-4-methyl-2-oxoglutarate aldolase
MGDLLATQAHVRGVAALLVDAAVRDVEELRALDLPIWARSIRVRGATKSEIGAINVPVIVGGAAIYAGDLVVLDADGAVVVAAEWASAVLEATAARVAREDALHEQLRAGALTYDLHGLRAQVEGAAP